MNSFDAEANSSAHTDAVADGNGDHVDNDGNVDVGDDKVVDGADVADDAAESDGALSAQLSEAQVQLEQAKDESLRARAEVENVRRRSQKEIAAARKFAIENFAQELLGVRDSLQRACEVELNQDAGDAVTQMKEGLALTLKQFDLSLGKFAVAEVAAAPGVRFDPQLHQAIGTEAAPDIAADHIVTVVQKGYTLNERLLRPAMVVVCAGQGDVAGGGASDDQVDGGNDGQVDAGNDNDGQGDVASDGNDA